MRRSAFLALSTCVVAVLGMTAQAASAGSADHQPPGQQLLPPGSIQRVMVIDLENESYDETYGDPTSYLNKVLVPQGELLKNYYATGHVSMDNYIAQVSGQAPNFVTSSDCVGSGGAGAYNDVVPGTMDANQQKYPGQVDGQGCVYPSTVKTIGDQLDAVNHSNGRTTWRQYAEDMGNDPVRDGGVPDPLGGTDCAHPTQTNGMGVDNTNSATATDQYANRHNPFVYFHSVTGDASRCASHVVPLGTVQVGTNGARDTFSGHLAQDLKSVATTPQFSFVTPNLCNDGHDPTPPATGCTGTNTEGTHVGGLAAMNIWLSHWMPLIMNSPAYRGGHMLVVITADEGGITDFAAGDNEQPGPGNANPGYSPLLNVPIPAFGNQTYYQVLGVTGLTPNVPPPAGTMPGGGHIGALLLNPKYVKVGTINTGGSYNHYSALRTYEDLLGINRGGADGRGHLGFAATATSFGRDVFVLPNH